MKDQKKNTSSRKKVYICSPFRPISTDPILAANELIDNLKLAKDACTFAAIRGCEPIAPHLYYPQFLNDDDKYERALGIPVLVFTSAGFRPYTGSGDMTDNCYADTADGVIE